MPGLVGVALRCSAYQITTWPSPWRTIGLPGSHLNAAAKAGRFEGAPTGFSPLKLREWFLTLPGVTSQRWQDGDPANNHNVLLRQKNAGGGRTSCARCYCHDGFSRSHRAISWVRWSTTYSCRSLVATTAPWPMPR